MQRGGASDAHHRGSSQASPTACGKPACSLACCFLRTKTTAPITAPAPRMARTTQSHTREPPFGVFPPGAGPGLGEGTSGIVGLTAPGGQVFVWNSSQHVQSASFSAICNDVRFAGGCDATPDTPAFPCATEETFPFMSRITRTMKSSTLPAARLRIIW